MTISRYLLSAILMLVIAAPVQAAITLVVSQKSGDAAVEQANRLATRLSSGLKDAVTVTKLPDQAQVEAWLNRFANADLALFETSYVTARPGLFMVFGQAAPGLTLVGRQGLPGDLPAQIEAVMKGSGGARTLPASVKKQAAAQKTKAKAPVATSTATTPKANVPTAAENDLGRAKSVEEDRFFVIQIYREKFGKEPEPERLEYWLAELQSGVTSKQQFAKQVCQQGMALCTEKD